MTIEHKSVPVGGLEVIDDEKGIVEAIVSVTGVVDEVNDLIEPGAYQKTLVKRKPKGIWSHSWDTPISKTLSAKELMPGDPELPTHTRNGEPWPKGAGALKVKTQFNLGTQRGREAYEDVKFFGADAEWSVGYKVPVGAAVMEQKSGGGGQIRRIREMDLYEYSPVLFGAMPLAATTSMKTAQQAMLAVKSVLAETKAGGPQAPIKAHPYVDRNGDDKCDICGKAEDDHGKKARTKSLPAGLETKSAPASPAPADALAGFDPEGASELDDVDELDAREVILSMVADGTTSDDDLRAMGFDDANVAAFRQAKALYDRLERKAAGVEIEVPFEEDETPTDDELAAIEREVLLDADDADEVFERVFEAALELEMDDETASDRAYAASRLFAAEAAAEAEDEAKDLIGLAFGALELKEGGADRNRGGAEKLRRYWTRGAGAAKIRWGTPGDWTRCVAQLTKYLGPRAKGYCNLRHKEMNGYYPGDDKNKGGDDVFVLDIDDVDATVAGLQAKLGRLLDEEKAGRLRIATKDLADALRDALNEAAGEVDDVDFDDLLMEFESLKLDADI